MEHHQEISPYQLNKRRCALCLNEKTEIATYRGTNLLNKKQELVSKCRYMNKYMLTFFDTWAVPKPNFFPIPIPILPIPKNDRYSRRRYFIENDGNFNLCIKNAIHFVLRLFSCYS